MADDLELDGGLGKVSETTPKDIEKFKEQLGKAKVLLQQLQKQEGKSKKRDNAVAKLLSRFVKSSTDQDILKIIVTCLALEVPVVFVVGILSLYYEEIYTELCEQLQKESVPQGEEQFFQNVEKEEDKDLSEKTIFNEHQLPDPVKKRINEWVKDIFILSIENKKRIITFAYPEGKPEQNTLELTTKILEKYLLSVRIEDPASRIQKFGHFILQGILRELEKK